MGEFVLGKEGELYLGYTAKFAFPNFPTEFAFALSQSRFPP